MDQLSTISVVVVLVVSWNIKAGVLCVCFKL